MLHSMVKSDVSQGFLTRTRKKVSVNPFFICLPRPKPVLSYEEGRGFRVLTVTPVTVN